MITLKNIPLKRIIPTSACLVIALAISVQEYCKNPDSQENETQEIEFYQDQAVVEDFPNSDTDTEASVSNTVQLTVGHGDTFAKLLKREGFSGQEIHHMMVAMQPHYNPKNLHPNHIIELTRDPKQGHFLVLAIRPQLGQEITVTPKDAGGYNAEKRNIKLEQTLRFAEGTIDGSLYQALITQGMPASMVQHMIMAYSYDVDFQRSIQLGDGYGVFFSTYKDPETGQERPGEILFAYLTLNGKTLPIYRFKSNSGEFKFYNDNGESVLKGLLRTPVDGARLSSHFGYRKHPVLGYNKLHKGIDFAAPTGTPIMAAGSGVVEKIGRWGSYGNYIRIRHDGGYSTAYAHMSRYAKGLRSGQRVRQGEIIGYIGATGRVTGAHLHYEVLHQNKHINPMKVKLIPATKLNGAELKRFQLAKATLDQQCLGIKDAMQEAHVQLAMKAEADTDKKTAVQSYTCASHPTWRHPGNGFCPCSHRLDGAQNPVIRDPILIFWVKFKKIGSRLAHFSNPAP